MYFLGIDKAKFRRPVTPGDRLDLEVAVVHHRTNVWKLQGEASVDGTLCASAELLASVVDRAADEARWRRSTRRRSSTRAPSWRRTSQVGPYAIVEAGVALAAGCVLHAHAVVRGPTSLGPRNVVHPFAVIGGEPQAKRHAGGPAPVEAGEGNVFREHVTVHGGTEGSRTRIGAGNLFMVGSHVAHDVVVGSSCVLANGVQLAGHAVIEDGVTFGGLSGVTQFVRVGESAFVAALSACERDVPRSWSCRATARACAASTSWACAGGACRRRASPRWSARSASCGSRARCAPRPSPARGRRSVRAPVCSRPSSARLGAPRSRPAASASAESASAESASAESGGGLSSFGWRASHTRPRHPKEEGPPPHSAPLGPGEGGALRRQLLKKPRAVSLSWAAGQSCRVGRRRRARDALDRPSVTWSSRGWHSQTQRAAMQVADSSRAAAGSTIANAKHRAEVCRRAGVDRGRARMRGRLQQRPARRGARPSSPPSRPSRPPILARARFCRGVSASPRSKST